MKIHKKVILLLMSVFLICGTGIVFGKYIEQKNAHFGAKIAKPVIYLENGENIKIDDNNKEAEYKFSVKNFDNNGIINEVNMDYTIEVISKDDSAITYTLYRDENEVPLNNKKTQKITIGRKNKEEHKYILKVKYEKEKSQEMKDLTQDIQIKISSEQKT